MNSGGKAFARKFAVGLVLVLAAAALYIAFMWPVPRHFGSGIPYTAYSTEKQEARMLVQGDHLQLMYHFGLARDMIAGKVPMFTNLYEFNLGDDASRRVVDPYYVPYSLVFAAVSPIFGDAAGWNAAQLVSVVVGFIFLFLLARRYADRDEQESGSIAFCAAFIASCLPYGWVSLAGGSPTGFGMSLVPGVALGIDMAVRDGKVRGGVLSGVLLLLCYATDLHSFFFAALAIPLWCLVSWLLAGEGLLPRPRRLLKIALPLAPLAACGIVAAIVAKYLRAHYSSTDVAQGRTFAEIRMNSPSFGSFVDYAFPGGMSHHFNIGMGVAVVLGICAAAVALYLLKMMFNRFERDRTTFCNWLAGFLVLLAIVCSIALALGSNGPWDALPMRSVRKLLPPYSMIRQPVKIYCLMPTLIAMSYALAFRYVSRTVRGVGILSACSILIACLVLFSTSRHMSAGISLLPGRNSAYTAVVEDAGRAGKTPRALVLPIWPGDSAWSSIYEYYAMQDGLRMLNGYSPVKTTNYVESVFYRFETVTQGQLDDEQLAAMRGFGVTGIILHEDAFPEKVSPFPVGVTLRRLLSSPHLELLKQDRSVWSFKLLDSPRAVGASEKRLIEPVFYAPALWKNFAKSDTQGVKPDALADGDLSMQRWFPPKALGDFSWAIRMDGGQLDVRTGPLDENEPGRRVRDEFATGREWQWFNVLAGDVGSDRRTWLVATGDAVVSDIMFTKSGAEKIIPYKDGRFILPAVDLFHAGYTQRNGKGGFDGIVFEPGHAPAAEIAYGPNLPLDSGPVKLMARAIGTWDAADDSTFRVLLGGREVASGKVSDAVKFEYDGSSVVTIRLAYSGLRTMTLRAFVISKDE